MWKMLPIALLASCTSYGIVGIGDDDVSDTDPSSSDPSESDPTDPTDPNTDTDTDTGTDTDTQPPEDDFSEYDDATLRIITPGSGDFLALESAASFEAELTDVNGDPLDYDEIVWTSSEDLSWVGLGLEFEDDQLDIGLHDITAEVDLPNGDRLAHTVGGVLVQSEYAGTYTGIFSAEVELEGIPVACAGAATIVVEPYGETASGDAECLINLLGFETELLYLFELENDEGSIQGTAAADLFGLFELPFEATGTLEADGHLEFTFGGDLGFILFDGGVDADRISLEAGL